LISGNTGSGITDAAKQEITEMKADNYIVPKHWHRGMNAVIFM